MPSPAVPWESHGFLNKHPWQTLTLIAADRFLVEQDLLKGEPTFAAPSTGEKLVKWKSERKNRTGSALNFFRQPLAVAGFHTPWLIED
jgi:hypothetical protein